jgi:TPR repeat protein
MLDEGDGVEEDKAEALRYFQLAAEQGDADAQFNLGLMYELGEGVAQNQAEAARLYRLASDQGHCDSQVNLGTWA